MRALGLVRVSKERDGMVSPELQRAAISEYAAARGYTLTGWVEGLDESGSRARSGWWKRLEDAVQVVERGEAEVLVVWKYSRAARNRLRWAVAVDRIETAGGRLESATEQIDTTSSTGRFTRGMLAELQAFEAERIGEVWKEVHARRIATGRPATGKPKWGYTYDQAEQIHRPDLVTGPVLAEAYRRYLAGKSVYDLVRWLNTGGWPTLTGGPWSDRTLRRVMDSGFAAGLFAAHGTLHEGAHEPLIDRDTWARYLEARAVRRARPPRVERSQYLLSGLVVCGRCKGRMVAGQFGHAKSPKYRCKKAKEQGPTVCTGGYVMASFVERVVLDWLTAHPEALERPVAALGGPQPVRRPVRGPQQLQRDLEAASAALQRLVLDQVKNPDIPDAVYAGARQKLVERYNAAEAALHASEAGVVDDQDPGPSTVPESPADLLARWESFPVEMRRVLIGGVIEGVWVWSGRPRATIEVRPRTVDA